MVAGSKSQTKWYAQELKEQSKVVVMVIVEVLLYAETPLAILYCKELLAGDHQDVLQMSASLFLLELLSSETGSIRKQEVEQPFRLHF